MSKFVVIDEMTHIHKLMEIRFDEFLEFLVRIAERANFSADVLGPDGGWDSPKSSDDDDDDDESQ